MLKQDEEVPEDLFIDGQLDAYGTVMRSHFGEEAFTDLVTKWQKR